jgi:asparagine synthase (glutamine-hydrolysing)
MDNVCVMCHERLSIIGVENGSQPIVSADNDLLLSVNGEIYNYQDINTGYEAKTKSDCEVIMNLYRKYGDDNICKYLDGVYCFVLYDKKNEMLLVARDPIGINPLYYGYDKHSNLVIASEHKSMDMCISVKIFSPGTIMKFKLNDLYKPQTETILKHYTPDWNFNSFRSIQNEAELCIQINKTLTTSVEKRLMAEVPFGVLLSGGLDSSLIASIATRLLKENGSAFGNKLHSFSIGLEGAPDLIAAKNVAEFLKTNHHEFTFTVQEGIDAIKDLIYHLETYDVTTIRASTPMYLLARKIKSMGIKMVLSGEGADEILGGYLYFHNAPDADEFHAECKRRVNDLHLFDCLRANKSTMAWGLEARVPFLDTKFLELCMPIHPDQKCDKIEKYILRKAFDTPDRPYLPNKILWRQKEQFSDGVGYSWIDGLKSYCEENVSDDEYAIYANNDEVRTKEAAYYLKIYESLFPDRIDVVKRWVPKQSWAGVGHDPSGRAQKVHDNKY